MLINGDCLEEMKSIESGSVDLIVADPPYNISKKSNFHTMKDRTNQRTGTHFGEWDYTFENSWIAEVDRLLKKGGWIVAFNDFKNATTIYETMKENGFEYKDTLIWEKSNPMPRNRDRRFISNVEMIQTFVKKGVWTFNRQNEKYEGSVLRYPAESGGGFKRYHPTQKNLKMIEYLVKIFSNENETVLDFTMGSGTTGVACKNLNRKFIGIELDENYFNIAKDRIENHIVQEELI